MPCTSLKRPSLPRFQWLSDLTSLTTKLVIMTYHDISWHIMTYHNISWPKKCTHLWDILLIGSLSLASQSRIWVPTVTQLLGHADNVLWWSMAGALASTVTYLVCWCDLTSARARVLSIYKKDEKRLKYQANSKTQRNKWPSKHHSGTQASHALPKPPAPPTQAILQQLPLTGSAAGVSWRCCWIYHSSGHAPPYLRRWNWSRPQRRCRMGGNPGDMARGAKYQCVELGESSRNMVISCVEQWTLGSDQLGHKPCATHQKWFHKPSQGRERFQTCWQ